MSNKLKIIIGAAVVAVIAVVLIVVIKNGYDQPYDYSDLSEYVKVEKYKGVEVDKVAPEKVTDKDVQAKIDEALESAKTTKDKKKGTVAKGDTCNIDFEGRIDGKTFDGGSATGASATAGDKDKYIEGFESGLVGMKIGESKNLNLKFPKDYGGADLAGKDVVFKVTVNSVVQNIKPKLNDEFVKKNTDYKTVAEYKKGIRKDLEKDAKEAAETSEKTSAWSKVVSSAEVKKYPKEELKTAKNSVKENLESYATQMGSDIDSFRAQMGLSEDKDYNKYVKEQAQQTVKNELVLYYIAQKEDIELDENPKDALEKMISDAGYDDSMFESNYGMNIADYVDAHAGEYGTSLLSEKVSDFVYSKAKIVEKKSK